MAAGRKTMSVGRIPWVLRRARGHESRSAAASWTIPWLVVAPSSLAIPMADLEPKLPRVARMSAIVRGSASEVSHMRTRCAVVVLLTVTLPWRLVGLAACASQFYNFNGR